MNVYMITAEGERRVVEATSFAAAIEAWRPAMIEEFDETWINAEPESVELISDDAVIRAAAKP